MPTFTERVKNLNVPLDQCVVIGSGLLDALGLRKANDIDLVVSATLFAQLKKDRARYKVLVKHNETYLLDEQNDAELWETWTGKGFDELYKDGTTIDGVRFVSPAVIIGFKEGRATEKDLNDVALLKAYENR